MAKELGYVRITKQHKEFFHFIIVRPDINESVVYDSLSGWHLWDSPTFLKQLEVKRLDGYTIEDLIKEDMK